MNEVLTVFEIAKESLDVVTELRDFTIDNKLLYNGVIMVLNLIEKFRHVGTLKDY